MSLIEVMMAVAILSVAILGVLSAVAFGLRSAAYGQRVTEATGYAREINECVRSTGAAFGPAKPWMNGPEITQSNWNSAAFAKLDEGDIFGHIAGGDVFRKRIQISQIGSSGYEAFLYNIQVTVYFYERGSIRRVQMNSIVRSPR